MINCHQATALMSQAQERELDWGERVSLRMHTLMCRGCRQFGLQMDTLRLLSRQYLRQAPETPATPEDPGGDATKH